MSIFKIVFTIIRSNRSMLLLLIPVLFVVACGGKEVKKVSQESQLGLEAFEVAEKIKVAYINKDSKDLELYTTKDGYRELTSSLKNFDHAELTFTPTWVEIEGTSVKLTISWKGSWLIGGKVTEDRGIAVFILQGSPLKLAQIQRANPFSQPE